MPKITVNDISMYYELHGSGEPLVLVSGFGADHVTWAAVLNALRERYQVILFNNRGAGQTDAPEGPYTILQMAQDVISLCENLGVTQAHFVGNSMGGCIVQALAYHYPAYVKSAVIANSAMAVQSTFYFYAQAQLELLKAKAPLASIIKATCSWIFSYDFLSKPLQLDALINFGVRNPYPFSIKGYEGQYAALGAFDARPWAHKITVPTLVIGADQDLVLLPTFAKALAEQIPGSIYYQFKNCGHLPHLEYPELYVEVLDDFIKNL